jgi:peptide/nickel transport system substrate-binding protein
VWSQAARPDGYPDAIVMKIGLSPEASTTAVEHGRLDYAPELPPDRIDEVVTRYAAQVHTSPLSQTNSLIMNTRGAPFSSIDARRAVSYALDRREMIRRGSDPRLAQPTCQILPRNFPGYAPYCPFSADATRAGVWLRPDLARARKLIARSGTRGSRVTVLIETGRASLRAAGYVVHLLDQLGYRASYKAFTYRQLAMAPAFSGRYGDAQIVMSSWNADYPSAGAFLQPPLSCGSKLNDSGFCDRTIDAEMRHAQALGITDSRAADAEWAHIDHQLTDAAAWIPFMSSKQLDFVSTRVGNFQFHPQWLMLFDQLWVR